MRKPPPDWLLALFLILAVYLWQRTTFPLWEIDLLPFQLAAYQYRHGDIEWIYAPIAKLAEWTERYHDVPRMVFQGEGFGNPFFYPPFVLPLLAPFSELPAYVWRNALFVINLSLILLIARFVLAACQIKSSLRAWLWATGFVLVAYPTARAIHLAQILPILVAMTWAGFLWMRQGRWLPSGIMLGIVSALKLFPLGFILIPVLLRQFRLCAVWVATIVVVYVVSILAMGTRIFQLWGKAVGEFGSLVYPFWGNQSLLGWWTRLFRDRPILECVPYSDSGVEIAKWTIAILVGGITVVRLWQIRHDISSNFVPAVGLLISGMLLSLASAWEHYWLWILPVLAWAIFMEWNMYEAPSLSTLLIAVAAFFILMKLTRFYGESTLGRYASGSQTIGMIMLWIWLICTPRMRHTNESLT